MSRSAEVGSSEGNHDIGSLIKESNEFLKISDATIAISVPAFQASFSDSVIIHYTLFHSFMNLVQ